MKKFMIFSVIALFVWVGLAEAKVYKSGDIPETIREKVAGGQGNLICKYAVPAGSAPEDSALQVIGILKLEPGDSVGFHQHKENEETYIFISGTGLYKDNDEKEYDVGPGDMTVTSKGQFHGLTNTSKEPLVFVGVIAK